MSARAGTGNRLTPSTLISISSRLARLRGSGTSLSRRPACGAVQHRIKNSIRGKLQKQMQGTVRRQRVGSFSTVTGHHSCFDSDCDMAKAMTIVTNNYNTHTVLSRRARGLHMDMLAWRVRCVAWTTVQRNNAMQSLYYIRNSLYHTSRDRQQSHSSSLDLHLSIA
jgi:hypothetical protein